MNLNDLMTTKYDYDYNHEQLHELLVNILAAGEITQDDNDEINKLLPQYTLDYNIITNYNIEEQKRTQEEEYQKLDDQKLNNSLPDLVDTLTGGGRSTIVQVGSDGKLYIDGNYVPKLKLVELDVQKLYANYAEINTLVANKATIQDLEATNAKIENLKADIGDFQDLTAVKADIQQLKTDTANINTALIGKAEITDLNAATANITALQTRVGQIDTLVGGNLTMDNIASLVLTSSKVTVDNGFIKNAMIDNIAANKITSGSINTNLVTLSSSDGSMTLNGSLQQFKDKNGKVRLQLGKDASGNFTFALFDETGTGQLITPNGITANAIGDGIIVNNMVADNANISGSKLDINSVVREVNNGTTTLKASIVKFDDKNQTLDVAFNAMNTTVNNNTSKIDTNTTNISTAQGQIQTLISNTTVTEDGKNKTIKEAYNSLKQTVNSLSSTMGSTTTEIETIKGNVDLTVKTVTAQYYSSTSQTQLIGGSWSDKAPTWEQGKYLWQRMKYIYTNGSSKFGEASCLAGAKGDTGQQGPQGPQGEKGETGANGNDGNPGRGITNITEYYLASPNNSGVTTSTSGWDTTIPTITPTNKYLWNYEIIKYSDNTTDVKNPKIIGAYGDKGQTGNTGAKGVSVKTITNHYLATASSSGVTKSTSGWTTTVQNVTSTKKYLWNYETVTFSDNSTVETDPMIIGAYGDKGATGSQGPKGEQGEQGPQGVKGDTGNAGQSVTSVTPQFQKHTSNTTAPTGTWSDTCPAYESGKYLWIRNKVVFANPAATKYTNAYYDPSWEAKGKADTAVTTVNNKTSEFQQTLDGFSTRVGNTETQVAGYENRLDTLDGQVKLGEDTEGNIIYVKDQVAQTTMDVKGIINKVGAMEANFAEDGTVTNLVHQVSQLQQTASQFTMEFFNKVENANQGVNTILDYITFDANGITIGQENYPVRLRLAKDRVVFLDVNNVELAYFRDDKLYVNNAEILDTIKIANYGFLPTANGSLTIGALS